MPQIKIKVIPRSSINKIIGDCNSGQIKVKLTSPPVDGLANDKLIRILSSELKIPKTNIQIIKGIHSKNKIIEIK